MNLQNFIIMKLRTPTTSQQQKWKPIKTKLPNFKAPESTKGV